MKLRKASFFLAGIYFGFVLSRSGVSDFRLIYGFFTGGDFTLAGVMITAIITAHAGMRILLTRGKTLTGEPLKIDYKGLHRLSLAGAALFGIGWGMSGSCPGTVLVQIGEGKVPALFTFSGIVAGTWLYALLLDAGSRRSIRSSR